MNIFRRELAANRKSVLTWMIFLTLLAVLFLYMFPAFTKDIEASKQILSNLPVAIRNALNISLGTFFTVYGFFAYVLTFVTLAAAVQAMNMGVGMFSKEDSGKTADFLLTKPVTRSKVVMSKLLAGLCLLVGSNIVFNVVVLIIAEQVTDQGIEAGKMLVLTTTVFLVQLFFFAIGFLLAMIIRKIKSVVSVSLPVVFSFFIIAMVGDVVAGDKVRYLTPFKFFNPMYIIQQGNYEFQYLLLELVVIVVAVITGFIIYNRKDIRAAS